MKVALLAGGLGTRIREETEFRPKPMVFVGNKPILWHIMRAYANYGHKEFVICAGYRGEVIREYFREYESLNSDFTVKLGESGKIQFHNKFEETGWEVTVTDTGQETMTGGRLFKARNYLGKDNFLCTYGDGLSDVNISKVLDFHNSHGKIATMTAVRPVSRFGILEIQKDGSISSFQEKPKSEGWINAGFFVFNTKIFDYLNENSILENEPLSMLAKENQLMAYKHDGFWQPMDTFREMTLLNELWNTDKAPWEGLVMANWSGRSVLVTGATGLVGSWLVNRLLKEGAKVTCLILDSDPSSELIMSKNIEKVSVVNGNLADIDTVSRAVNHQACETIFHLGAQTIVGTAFADPVDTFRSNIQGTWNLLEVARRSNGLVKRLLIASSDKAYGSSKVLPYTEEMHLHGSGPYDVSKSATDLLSQSYGKTYGLPVVVARCGNIYGGGDLNWSRIVPGTIRSLLSGETPVLRSDGKFLRDYIYVEDAVDAYMHMADESEKQNLKGEAFNFSRNEPLSVLDIYNEVCKATVGSVVKPNILNSASNEIRDQYLDSTKAHKKLGWSSKIDLQTGLAKTVAWYKDYFKRVGNV